MINLDRYKHVIQKYNKKYNIVGNPNSPRIDFGKLKKVCRMKTVDFHHFGKKIKTIDGIYYFQDNKANILFVGHLDTRLPYTGFDTLKIDGETEIYCKTLDDRLGVYLGLFYLKQLGMDYDILLTTGEEVGNSTSQWFETKKKYNWIFSFDRAGTGVVQYQYKYNKDANKALREAEFVTMHGTYSDIVDLEHLGCVGFNFGTGYYDNHSVRAFAKLSVIREQLKKFKHFYFKNATTMFTHKAYSRARYNILTSEGYKYDPRYGDEVFSQIDMQYMMQEGLYEELQKNGAVELGDKIKQVTITPKELTKIIAYKTSNKIKTKSAESVDTKPISTRTKVLSLTRKCIDCGEPYEVEDYSENMTDDWESATVAFCPRCLSIHYKNFNVPGVDKDIDKEKIRTKISNHIINNSTSWWSLIVYMRNHITPAKRKDLIDRLLSEEKLKPYWKSRNKLTPKYVTGVDVKGEEVILLPNRIMATYIQKDMGIESLDKYNTKMSKAISRIELMRDYFYKDEPLSVYLYATTLYPLTSKEGKSGFIAICKAALNDNTPTLKQEKEEKSEAYNKLNLKGVLVLNTKDKRLVKITDINKASNSRWEWLPTERKDKVLDKPY